jgi:hypothetical protein
MQYEIPLIDKPPLMWLQILMYIGNALILFDQSKAIISAYFGAITT